MTRLGHLQNIGNYCSHDNYTQGYIYTKPVMQMAGFFMIYKNKKHTASLLIKTLLI